MDDPHGLTQVTPGAGASAPLRQPPASAQDHHLHEVQRAVGTEYDVLGDLCDVGEGGRSGTVFLAQQHASPRFEALRLLHEAGYVEVLGTVGDAPRIADDTCPTCGKPIRAVRFCGNCRADLSTMSLTASPGSISVADWQAAKHEAGRNSYDLLGQIREAYGGPPGGSLLLAGRMSGTSRIVGLVLERPVDGRPAVLGIDQANRVAAVIESLFEVPAEPLPPVVSEPVVPLTEIRGVSPMADPTPVVSTEHPAWMRVAAIALSSAAVIAAIAWLVTALSGPGDKVAPTALADSVPVISAPPVTPPPAVAVVDSATLQISADLPAGASITVDGRRVSSATIMLAPGTHRLSATAPGYRTMRQTLDVRPGETSSWAPRLVAVPKPVVAAPPTGSPCRVAVGRNDWTRALDLCASEASSARGNAYAERMLGTMYERGLGVAPSQTLAGVWYAASAGHGDREGQYRYALMLQNGTGVRRNLTEAAQLYRKAADQGHAEAQLAMGLLHITGEGVVRSESDAARWLRRAAAQGNRRARQELTQRGW